MFHVSQITFLMLHNDFTDQCLRVNGEPYMGSVKHGFFILCSKLRAREHRRTEIDERIQ